MTRTKVAESHAEMLATRATYAIKQKEERAAWWTYRDHEQDGSPVTEEMREKWWAACGPLNDARSRYHRAYHRFRRRKDAYQRARR